MIDQSVIIILPAMTNYLLPWLVLKLKLLKGTLAANILEEAASQLDFSLLIFYRVCSYFILCF